MSRLVGTGTQRTKNTRTGARIISFVLLSKYDIILIGIYRRLLNV